MIATSLYINSTYITNLYEKGNEPLANYKCWFDSNMLTLNTQKTHSVVFHRKQRKIPPKYSKLSICAAEVTKVICATEVTKVICATEVQSSWVF